MISTIDLDSVYELSIEADLKEEEKIDSILDQITLQPPRTAYTIYYFETKEKYESLNKKIKQRDILIECSKTWSKLEESKKKKYIEKSEEEKKRYIYEVEIVRHYLFKDYNEIIQKPPTAYNIFVNERMVEGFKNNYDPKEVKKLAYEDWKKMDNKEKEIYFEKKDENDNIFEKAKNLKKINGMGLFIQEVFQKAINKNLEQMPSLQEIIETWKSSPSAIKQKFEKYAKELNEERQKLTDIYELVNGIKPKLPAGAFKIFVQEKCNGKSCSNMSEMNDMWNKLNDDEKEVYLKKAHRLNLAYQYKKMIFKKKIKKFIPKRPTIITVFMKYCKVEKSKNHIGPTMKKAKELFEKLPEEEKKKYQEKYNEEMKIYREKMEEFHNKVFDMPKPPSSGYQKYLKEKLAIPRTENGNEGSEEYVQRTLKYTEEWEKKKNLREKYEKKVEKEKKLFLKQMKEFQKHGYYTKENVESSSENEDDEKEKDEDEKEKDDDEKEKDENEKEKEDERKKTNKKTQRMRSISTGKKKKTRETQKNEIKVRSPKKSGKKAKLKK